MLPSQPLRTKTCMVHTKLPLCWFNRKTVNVDSCVMREVIWHTSNNNAGCVEINNSKWQLAISGELFESASQCQPYTIFTDIVRDDNHCKQSSYTAVPKLTQQISGPLTCLTLLSRNNVINAQKVVRNRTSRRRWSEIREIVVCSDWEMLIDKKVFNVQDNLMEYVSSNLKRVFYCAENHDWKLIFISWGHVLRDWQWGKIDVTDRMFCLADENNGRR